MSDLEKENKLKDLEILILKKEILKFQLDRVNWDIRHVAKDDGGVFKESAMDSFLNERQGYRQGLIDISKIIEEKKNELKGLK